MEMFVPQNQAVLDSILPHNHNQVKCKYYFEPKRNSLKIGLDDNYDRTILNDQIIFRINFLEEIGIKKFDEIRSTPYTWFLKLNNSISDVKLEILLSDPTLVYLEISNHIIKNQLMIDIINNFTIKYNPKSFRQLDDSIKFKLYEILFESVKSENLYLIGGESLFFIKLLNPKKYILYTDFESIYNDAITNLSDLNSIKLISYETDSIKLVDEPYDVILNTSKHGLGVNLCRNILKLDQQRIIIISCNKKSFEKDMKILSQKYKIERQIDIETNYVVTVYFIIKV
jgi:hypothetical protein